MSFEIRAFAEMTMKDPVAGCESPEKTREDKIIGGTFLLLKCFPNDPYHHHEREAVLLLASVYR